MWDDSGNPLLTVARRNKAWVIPKTSSSSPPSLQNSISHKIAQNLKTGITSSFLLWEQSRSLSSYRDHLHILHIQITFRSHQDQQMALVLPLPTTFPHLASHFMDLPLMSCRLKTFSIYKVWHYVFFLFQDTIFKMSHLHRSIIGRKFALDQTRSARSTETRSTRWRDTNKRGCNTSTFEERRRCNTCNTWRDTNKRGCNTSTFEEGSTRWILDQ